MICEKSGETKDRAVMALLTPEPPAPAVPVQVHGHPLERLFSPHSIAVFGASERPNAVGTRVLESLLSDKFPGPVYPVNPKHDRVRGLKCFHNIDAIGEPVDLAVVATPAPTVPGIIRECGEHGVRAAIVLSAGFGEIPGIGTTLQQDLLREARRHNLRLLGPNCLGLIRPSSRLNATFSKNTAQPGPLALVSQSGALCTAILDWATSHGIGFSAVVSLGDAADIDFGELLDYLALDPLTSSILLYVEGIRHARRFMSGLRGAARLKPVIVVKAGRHEEGSRAAMSHTGALVGGDDVFEAALQRAGVVRAMSIEQLFSAAQLLAIRHRLQGNRLAIISNAGGPGVMATDRAIDLGVRIANLSPDTSTRLDSVLPAHWSHGNPIDILGDADPPRYRAAVETCLADPGIDGALVMLTPQAMTLPLESAQAVIAASEGRDKPVLACWMGEEQVKDAWAEFARQKIPAFPSPEASVEAFAYLAAYQRNQQELMQVPGPLSEQTEPDVEGARMIIDSALAERRPALTGLEARALLAAFKIPTTPSIEARSASEALVAAESLGFPVALKISSLQILHKSDVDGVRLNIADAHAVRRAYNEMVEAVRAQRPEADIRGVTVERMYRGRHGRELIIGAIRDPVFGPVVSFGAGGTAVEVLRDRAVALPPLNSYLAHNLIDRTRISRMLEQFRNLPPARRDAIEQVLLRVSELLCELPQIRGLDINPLMADEVGVVALDARVEIEHRPPQLDRYGHMAIHPYPVHLVSHWQLPDGTDIVIRPIRPEDAEIEQVFVRNLSPESKYFRFMQSLQELSAPMLVRLTQIDYDRELALVALVLHDGREEVEIGVTRYATNPDGETCEFALVVADAWQGKGIGSRLLTALMEAAKARGLKTVVGDVLDNNVHMLDLAERLGFDIRRHPDDEHIRVVSKGLT